MLILLITHCTDTIIIIKDVDCEPISLYSIARVCLVISSGYSVQN